MALSKNPSTLISVLNSAVEEAPQTPNPNAVARFRPSMLGTPCLRKLFYAHTNTAPAVGVKAATGKIFMVGRVMGEALAQIYFESGHGVKYRLKDGSWDINPKTKLPNYEFPVSDPELQIHDARIDLVLILDGVLWLGEFKTKNSRKFAQMEKPDAAHLIQTSVYLYLFNFLLKAGEYDHIPELAPFKETGATGVRILYFSKDDGATKEYVLAPSPQIFKHVVNKIQVVQAHVAAKTLPPTTPDFCSTCVYKPKCDKNFNPLS